MPYLLFLSLFYLFFEHAKYMAAMIYLVFVSMWYYHVSCNPMWDGPFQWYDTKIKNSFSRSFNHSYVASRRSWTVRGWASSLPMARWAFPLEANVLDCVVWLSTDFYSERTENEIEMTSKRQLVNKWNVMMDHSYTLWWPTASDGSG